MKQLIYSTGGQPIRLNDFQAIEENIKGLTSALANISSNVPYILYGASITVSGSGGATPLLSITKGALWYLDEVYLIDAVTDELLPGGTDTATVRTTYEWDLESNISDNRTFNDASSNNVLTNRKTILTATPVTWSGLVDLPDSTDVLQTKAQTQTKSFITLLEDSAGLAIGGYYSLTDASASAIVDNNLTAIELYAKVTMDASMPNPIPRFRLTSTSFTPKAFRDGAYLPVIGGLNGSIDHFYLQALNATNLTFDVYKMDGTNFIASDLLEIWYNGVNIT